jgi:NitT/TauT family transport system substrate-binding protein
MRSRIALLAAAASVFGCVAAAGEDALKISVSQRGLWDTAVSELGQRAGIMKKHGLDLEILYTSGGAESQQALIAGSVELACGGGIEGAIGAYSKGAPLRIIGSEMIGSPDTYWYVVANSPIQSIRDAAGKTISYSVNGSSSHAAVLSLISQYKVDAKPVATGSHPATLTMTMTGQIDIGRGAAPFGLELVEEGKIRVIARGSEIAERANQTVRVCIAHAQAVEKRKDMLARFMQAYRDTIDWMYSDPAALDGYQDYAKVPARLMAKWRDQYFPKATIWPDEIKGLDLILADAQKNKFIASALGKEQIAEMIQIPRPLK